MIVGSIVWRWSGSWCFYVGVESGVGGAVAVGELVRVFHQWQEGAVVEVRPEAFA